jgi:steroid delta-isomerase-like uncharacterized protein
VASAEENAAYIRHGIEEIFNRRNMTIADERFAEDIVLHSPAQDEPLRGRETLKEFIGKLHTAFPDMHVTLEDLVTAGDRVVTRCTTRGTQDGEYFGTPATGNSVIVNEVQIYRVVDGKIVELWLVFNVLGVLQQLGVIPAKGLPRPLLELICWGQRRASRKRRKAGTGARP